MAQRRVFANVNNGQLLLVVTERSTVMLEPFNLEFETIEEAFEYVVTHPLEFPSEVYEPLLEQLNALRGGS